MQTDSQNLETHTSQKPSIFFLLGLMGTGKTYWGQALAANNNFNFIDLDTAIENNIGLPISQIFATKGEAFFREKEAEILKFICKKTHQHTIVATGGGTPCFSDNINWMNKNGITIWLNGSIENIVERTIGAKLQRPLIANIPNQNLYSFFANQLQERSVFYNQSKHCLNVEKINENYLQKIINLYV